MIRSLSPNTIQTHLAHFVGLGKLEASELIDINKVQPITAVVQEKGMLSLKAIKETLGEDYSYFEIHVSIAYMKWLEQER